MISMASQNIKKLNANLKHHVLSSEFCEDENHPERSKYVDLLEGSPYDTQIIGDGEDTPQDAAASVDDLLCDPNSTLAATDKEKQEALIESVPILFRVRECKLDESF